ncbi:FAD:protein FMN transferase [Shigella sonnei]
MPASPTLMPKRSAELKEKIQTQLDATIKLLSTCIKDSALMHFNDSQSLSPWPVSEAMAISSPPRCALARGTDGAMDITVGPLVDLWGLARQRRFSSEPGTDRSMKAKTGLQHLTVINQSHQRYLQKNLPDLYVDFSTVGEGYAAESSGTLDGAGRDFRYVVWWAAR